MKFALLTRFVSATSPAGSNFFERLSHAALMQGHTLTLLNPAEFSLSISGEEKSPLHWNGRQLPDFDLVHHALRWNDEHAWQILAAMQEAGQPLSSFYRLPQGDAVTMARLLSRAGIRTPRSWFFAHPDQLLLMQAELPFPCLFYSRGGLLGNGGIPNAGRQIVEVHHVGEAAQLAKKLTKGREAFMVQEILQPLGTDVQVLAVAGQVAPSSQHPHGQFACRVLAAQERRVTIHQFRPQDDGTSQTRATVLSAEEEAMVHSVMRLKHLPYAAINLLRLPDGPVLLEVSTIPNLLLAEATTGLDFASAIVRQFAELAEAQARQHREKGADGQVVTLGVH